MQNIKVMELLFSSLHLHRLLSVLRQGPAVILSLSPHVFLRLLITLLHSKRSTLPRFIMKYVLIFAIATRYAQHHYMYCIVIITFCIGRLFSQWLLFLELLSRKLPLLIACDKPLRKELKNIEINAFHRQFACFCCFRSVFSH